MATADTSIFSQFLRPPKSVDDYTAEADAKESNRLQLMLQRGAVSDKMQAQEQQRNLMRTLQGLGPDAKDEDFARAYQGAGQVEKANAIRDGVLKRTEMTSKVAKEGADTEKLRFETAINKQAQIAQAAGAATDQASWERGLDTVAALGVDISKIPRQFDPQLAATLSKQAMTGAQQLEQVWKQKGYTLDVAKADETKRNNIATDATSRSNNANTVGASLANAGALREQAQATRDAANIQTGFKNEAELRKEFEGLPEVKNYKQAYPSLAAIRDAATRSTPQSDINIVYGIAKLYDPTSVVREGEYATVANSPAIPERIKGYAQYIAGGGRLSAETKKQMLTEAEGRASTYKAEVDKAKSSYEGIAKRRGIDASNVFQDMGDLSKPTAPTGGADLATAIAAELKRRQGGT